MNDWEVIIVRTFEEMEAIRDVWEQMQHNESPAHIDADYDRYLSVLKAADESIKPYIILIKQNGCLKTMVIARTETRRIACRIGYLTILKPRMRCLSVVYGGILGQPNNEVCSFLVNELLRILRGGEIDTIFFNHLRTESDLFKAITTQAGFFHLGRFPKIEPHWAISIPETMDQLYKRYSPKNRSNLRRLINRLEKKYQDQIKVVTYTQQNEVDKAIEAIAKISAQTYQSQLYNMDSEQIRILLKLAASRGWLRAYVLFIDEEPVAYEIALKYGSSYFGLYTGFDPKWKQYRIGTVTLLKFLESICGDPEAKLFDFGFGDAHYKRLYADICWQEASIYLFATKPYPLVVNLLHSTITGISLGINWSLNKTGLTNRIKRLWRNRLEEKASQKET